MLVWVRQGDLLRPFLTDLMASLVPSNYVTTTTTIGIDDDSLCHHRRLSHWDLHVAVELGSLFQLCVQKHHVCLECKLRFLYCY